MNPQDHPLLALPKYGDGVGLHRVAWLLDEVGVDRARLAERSLVVTGSNGKGSTARIVSGLMRAAGGPVGLFTSPHLFRFNERFQIDDAPLGDDALNAVMDIVADAVAAFGRRRGDRVGAFEAQFVTAALAFQQAGLRWQVFEAGIGGRYDPVRLVRAPATALVSLDLEHTELLGRTLAEIAFDKLDATPPGGAAILGESCLPLREEIEAFAEVAGIAVRFVTPSAWRDLGVEAGVQRFDLPGLPDLRSVLVGRHQINNHAVAVELCRERLARSGASNPTAEALRAAIATVRWPGRLEKVQDHPPVYVDVGHTPEGVRAALAGFQRLSPGPAVLVTGVSADKDAQGIFDILAPAFDRIICTAAHHKGLAADRVAVMVHEAHPAAEVRLAPTIAEAARLAAHETDAVYAAGGLFLATEFSAALRGEDPSALRFF